MHLKKINANELRDACKVEICWPWQLMERMGAERQTWLDLERGKLVLLIEAEGRQGRTRQADLCVKFTEDGGENLQNNKICAKTIWRIILTKGLQDRFKVWDWN